MIRLAKYLKPYLAMVLLNIVLLFAQANFDLALPDYLSDIVNIGIQQGGVEDVVPVAIRQSQMDRLTLFMNADEAAAVLDAYTLADQDSADYDALVEDYPALAEEPIYLLNEIDREDVNRLNPVLGEALLAVSAIEHVVADPSAAAEMGGELGFDPSMIPPGMDVFALLQMMPAAQRAQLTAAVDARFVAMGESMVLQAAVGAVKAEYEALGMDTARLQNAYILRVGGMMLLLTLLSGICTIVVGYTSARTAAGMARDIRQDVFRHVESFSSAEFNTFSTASLITRSTNDVTQLQMLVMIMMRMVFYAPMMGIGGIMHAVGKGGSMWWLIAVAVMILVGMVTAVISVALPKFKIIQQLIDRINLVAREGLSGMMVIRAFNMQAFEEARFDKANIDLTAVSLFINRLMVVMMPLMMLLMNGLSIAIIWAGAHQIAEAKMQVGDMMAFIQYAMQIVMSFLMLTMLFIFLPRASVSADRIAEVLDTEPQIHDPEQPLPLPTPARGRIEFRDVSFRYPGAPDNVLCHISFTAEPGQTTAFIGSTGCGKSTLVNLIPRFYDVTEGAVLIDGVDVRHVTQRDLRERIGYIPQTGVLFSGTVGSNLRYADEDASPEMLREAIDIAQASEFVFANPQELEAEIAQGGTNVSGGQKQRLSIARALVKKPPIYIFDDSFSALDFRTDAALRAALKEKTGDSAVLIVTQRVSTVKNAEQIIVLDEGEIVGKGTHHELMETCETYQEIALSQLSMEELA
ncbi:MAG: ABC transporter ATP-binding protein [Anaerolineae bacterium]|nr:ABC transporter ATP-binding protein [Anaerolineae bacterium]